jgi:ABC-type multidrug transport system ATPase subunit
MELMNKNTIKDESVRVKLMEISKTPVEGLRLLGISKTYRKNLFWKSDKDLDAVKNLYLDVAKDELLVLLGHNGAGKTTLIGMLTGLLNSTQGTAIVCGYDLEFDMETARKHIGFCPQFDILWEDLTGREHLRLFGKLKGVSEQVIEDVVSEKLQEIGLLKDGESPVSTYSGGMKRRLSVAIASIGKPQVIFMDEPTTGMDPISRRFVWEMIQKIKKNKAVILTTHSMEEAEALGDRLVVMADGEFRCIGNSLYLKNHYGEGYRISIITSYPEETFRLLREIVPSAKLEDSSGGSLMVSVPKSEPKQIERLFSVMEGQEESELVGLINDWGISNSTLEEVFIKATDKPKPTPHLVLS